MTGAYGAYGKIPGAGDFIRFGLPGDFINGWDAWLQAGLVQAAKRLGDLWDEAYFSAPIWRFGLPPEAVGKAAVIGVLMPSVDRVGRRFPLTLAKGLPTGASLIGSFLHGRDVFAALEDIALSALDTGNGPAELEQRLADVPAPVITPAREVAFGDMTALQRDGDANSVADLATALVGSAADAKSLWCTQTEAGSMAFAAPPQPSATVFSQLMHPFAEREAV